MIDVETGQAIYKRTLMGVVPSEPAAVERRPGRLLDRIYIGTGAGKMYRVDLAPDTRRARSIRPCISRGVHAVDGLTYTVQRVEDYRLGAPPHLQRRHRGRGAPSPRPRSRPIYYPFPSVIFVPKLGLYALSFGTGDREDLWTTPRHRALLRLRRRHGRPSGTVLDEGRFHAHPRDLARHHRASTCSTGLTATGAGTWCSTPTSG